MKHFPRILALAAFTALVSRSAVAQDAPSLEVQALSQILPGTVQGHLDFDPATGEWAGTNGIFVRYGAAVLTADAASVNSKTGEVQADGHVRIESDDQLWVGDHIADNFKTRQMRSEQFRTGRAPVFAGGAGLTGDGSTRVYTAQSAFITTDDASDPAYRVRASRIKIIPGKSVQIEAVWIVRKSAGGVSLSGRTIANEPAPGDYEALAAAHSRALARVSGDLAAAIRTEADVKP